MTRSFSLGRLALSSLSWDQHRVPWPDPASQATLPLPRTTLCRACVPAGLELLGAIAWSQTTDYRHGDACQWDSRHCTRLAHQYEHRHDGM